MMEFGVRRPDGKMVPWSEVPEEELAKIMDRVSGDGPGDVSPEELVEDLIGEHGEKVEPMLRSELAAAFEIKDEFEIGFWKAALGYLARRNGTHIREV